MKGFVKDKTSIFECSKYIYLSDAQCTPEYGTRPFLL